MHECSASVHHADPLGLHKYSSIGTIHECNPDELLTRAALMHHKAVINYNTLISRMNALKI